jgi:hypothetical protein
MTTVTRPQRATENGRAAAGDADAAALRGRRVSAAEETGREVTFDLVDRDAFLSHGVALAHGDGLVLQ